MKMIFKRQMPLQILKPPTGQILAGYTGASESRQLLFLPKKTSGGTFLMHHHVTF